MALTVTLNADGTISIQGDGDTEDFNFTYTVDNGNNADTGVVYVSSVPCFVASPFEGSTWGAAGNSRSWCAPRRCCRSDQ